MQSFRMLRLNQWTKNLLVFSAPFFAGKLTELDVLKELIILAFSFSLIASSIYIFNDFFDKKLDQSNPLKSMRPIASGKIPHQSIVIYFLLCFITGFTMSIIFFPEIIGVLAGYFLLNVAYSMKLKNVPITEFIFVSLGFPIRSLVGALITNTPISAFFLIVLFFGSLTLVLSKRISESKNIKIEFCRPVLSLYPKGFLEYAMSIAASITLTAFAFWALSYMGNEFSSAVSLIAAAALVFRIGFLCQFGKTEMLETLIFKDIFCLVNVSTIIAVSTLGIY
jgi:decaprenyl-phosphate phosphoribosyltransferase